MIRAAAPLALAFCVFACALAGGCAAPGEPTARHPVVPVAVTDLAARQSGNAFALTFTLPARSMDREALAEHPAIEIYRAALPPGATPDKKTPWRLALHDSIRAGGSLSEGRSLRISRSPHGGRFRSRGRIIDGLHGSHQGGEGASLGRFERRRRRGSIRRRKRRATSAWPSRNPHWS